jgi:hypothetical protein
MADKGRCTGERAASTTIERLVVREKGKSLMEEILATGTTKDIAALIDTCGWPGEAFVLCEQLPQRVIEEEERYELLRFARLSDDGIMPLIAASTWGRVFHPDFELRWEKGRSAYQVVYLGTQSAPPMLKPDEETGKHLAKNPQLRSYYLLGEALGDDDLQEMGIEGKGSYYAEVRIPRLLNYPINRKAQRVKITVREYVDAITGQVALFRFQDLVAGE